VTETRARGWIAPALATLGLADAAYLAILHFQGEVPPCGGYAGCGQVNSSPYAELFGFPIAAFGALIYLAILAAALWRWRAGGEAWAAATLVLYTLSLAATVFMSYLTALELFVIQAICYWCVALAAITLVLLGLSSRDVLSVGSRPAGGRASSSARS